MPPLQGGKWFSTANLMTHYIACLSCMPFSTLHASILNLAWGEMNQCSKVKCSYMEFDQFYFIHFYTFIFFKFLQRHMKSLPQENCFIIWICVKYFKARCYTKNVFTFWTPIISASFWNSFPFWLIGLKSQWAYLIINHKLCTICLWTHSDGAHGGRYTLPTPTPTHPYPYLPPPTPTPTHPYYK